MRFKEVGKNVVLVGLVIGIGIYLTARVIVTFYVLSYSPVYTKAREAVAEIPVLEPKTVLVTGAAGFIGFHLAKRLSQDPENIILAMDNFNNYYDVRLKIDRAYELHKLGVVLYHEDLCNEEFLRQIFQERRITHVAHLAAQAGVRYSLDHPLTYVRSNVECQLNLLHVLKDYPDTKLVYASSSSVYGKESSVPFSLGDNTDSPGNMYAATKKTDEMLGEHYCQYFNVSAVGLRFFTVYGPWGRPDMAVFKFAESILDGKEVPMYHISDDVPLGRDFTYIDDLIHGIVSALDYRPVSCEEVFNLGLGSPVSVPRMVKLLETELKTTATVKKLPLPPTEIIQTWADISDSTKYLNFRPSTTLKEGIQQFSMWLRGYRNKRKDELNGKIPWSAGDWYKRLEADRKRRNDLYQEERIKSHNAALNERLQHERLKYLKVLSSDEGMGENENITYKFFQGVDSNGGDIIREGQLKNQIQDLKYRCSTDPYCIAFNSDGVLKRSLLSKSSWTGVKHFQGPSQGLYVAEIDICGKGLHQCSRNSECVNENLGQYKCQCKKTFYGDGKLCLPRYEGERPRELELEYKAESFSLHKIADMKKQRELIFFQGMDSHGGDYLVADQYKGNHAKLIEICSLDPICIGVNTNGLLKRRIQNRDTWIKWSSRPSDGLYVFDMNYCLLWTEACPERSTCGRAGPADYRCICEVPYIMSDSGSCVLDPEFEKLQAAAPVTSQKKEQEVTGAPGHIFQPGSIIHGQAYGGKTGQGNAETGYYGAPDKKPPESSSQEKVIGSIVDVDGVLIKSIPETGNLSSHLHILLSADSKQYKYLVTLMNSIVSNTYAKVHFHISICGESLETVKSYLSCYDFGSAMVNVVEFPLSMLDATYKSYMSKRDKGTYGYLSNCANYARFFFHKIFPTVNGALYLDVDTIVKDDLAKILTPLEVQKKTLGVVIRQYTLRVTIRNSMLSGAVNKLYETRKNAKFNLNRPAFNAGVFYVNLNNWRRNANISDELRFWMKMDVEQSLWTLGSQPLMWMVFHDDCVYLQEEWHLDGLGYLDKDKDLVARAKVLHWNGHNKPWNNEPKSTAAHIWSKYTPSPCGGKGKCKENKTKNMEKIVWHCVDS